MCLVAKFYIRRCFSWCHLICVAQRWCMLAILSFWMGTPTDLFCRNFLNRWNNVDFVRVRQGVCMETKGAEQQWKRFPLEEMMINVQAGSRQGVTGPRQWEREGECLCLDNKLLQLIYSCAGRVGDETVGFAVGLSVPMQWKGNAVLDGEWIIQVLWLLAD